MPFMIKVVEIMNEGNKNGKSIKLRQKNIKQSLCDYSDAYILVTGDVRGTNGECTNVAFKSNSYKCIMQNSYKQ